MNLQQNIMMPKARENLLADMRLGQIRHRMIRIEDIAPDFTLVNQRGEFINLVDQLVTKSVVLVFATGSNTLEDRATLCALDKLRSSIDANKASLMLIAPHSKALDDHRDKCDWLDTEILHDVGNHVASRYGLIQDPVYSSNEFYEEFAANDYWQNHTEMNSPVPAIYVIHPNRRIAFSRVKTEHSFDINTNELIATLTGE